MQSGNKKVRGSLSGPCLGRPMYLGTCRGLPPTSRVTPRFYRRVSVNAFMGLRDPSLPFSLHHFDDKPTT